MKNLQPNAVIYNNGAVAKKDESIIFEEPIPIDIGGELLKTCSNEYNLINTKVVTYKGDFSNAENISSNEIGYVYDDYNNFEDNAYKITIKADPSVAQQLANRYNNCCMIKFKGYNSYMFTFCGSFLIVIASSSSTAKEKLTN